MAILIRLLCLALLLTFPAPARADDHLQLAEQEIKAGMLYNFLKYTDWPQDGSAPMTVCIFGDDPFAGYLQPMATRTVNQRPIVIRYLKDFSGVAHCNLLFVNARAQDEWPKLRQSLAEKNILTVSDFDGFSDAGGAIEFTHKDNRISVELNMEAVTAAKLHVQDRLLKLVTIVHLVPQERP